MLSVVLIKKYLAVNVIVLLIRSVTADECSKWRLSFVGLKHIKNFSNHTAVLTGIINVFAARKEFLFAMQSKVDSFIYCYSYSNAVAWKVARL